MQQQLIKANSDPKSAERSARKKQLTSSTQMKLLSSCTVNVISIGVIKLAVVFIS